MMFLNLFLLWNEDKNDNDDPNPTELSRGKGVQYPFAVFDRVIIKVSLSLYSAKHIFSSPLLLAMTKRVSSGE
jgi:hypothetical protein